MMALNPRRARPFVMAFLLIAAAACRPDEGYSDQRRSPAPPDPVARSACETAGGRYEFSGMAMEWFCTPATSDAGKACTDSSQCSGMCLAKTRTCAPQDPMTGCFDYIESGEIRTRCSLD